MEVKKEKVYVCRRCHKHIWVTESIIRGMGPICFGKNYAIRKMLIQGLSKEQILKITKEQMNDLGKKGLKEHKKVQRILKKKARKDQIRMKKIKKEKRDKNQLSIELFFLDNSESQDGELESMKKQLYNITNRLSKTNGVNESTQALELMDKIKKLEDSK